MVCLAGAFAGMWRGYGGMQFAFALATFAALFAVQVCLAAENVAARLAASFHPVRLLLPILPFLVYLAYALGAGIFSWRLTGLALVYALAPCTLLFAADGKAPGAWQDYAAVLCIWLPPEMHLLQTAFPFPSAGLSHPLWAAYAISAGLIAFLLVRRLEGVGYRVAWGRSTAAAILLNLAWFLPVAIVLGRWIHFIEFGPTVARARALPLVALGILFFNAWPEEFLFRGLLQNLLSSTMRSEWAGLIFASVIFGLAHLNNGGFPNWRYALLATLAGLAYGSAWRATRSIFASALVHACVNTLWYAFFPTVPRG